jgi:FAD:protein FMN transferase
MRGLAVVVALSCAGCAARLERFEYAAPAMGTEFRLAFYAPDEARARSAAEAAFECIRALDAALSDYRTESELSRLGALSDGTAGEAVPSPWIELSPELGAVLAAAQHVARASGGGFDVTVGPYTRLWRRAGRQGELPSQEHLAEASAAVGYEMLELDREACHARMHARGMRFDLGGIAKGYASDRALDVLAAHGIERALAVGGGDVVARAPPPGESGWHVDVAGFDSAEAGTDRASTRMLLAHGALSTSGDLVRFLELDGARHSHILDPRTGLALTERCLASVRAPDGMRADAWATALSVLGPAGLECLAREPGLEGRLVREGPGGLELFRSEGFR